MKRVAVLVLVSLAGLTLGACNKQEPVASDVNGPIINGISPGHMSAGDPTILEDQRAFYEKHVLPVAPASAPAATEAAADATTAPATAPTTAPATAPSSTPVPPAPQ